MRVILIAIVLLATAEGVDVVWFNGQYSRAAMEYIGQETKQVKSQVTSLSMPISAPNLGHFWKVP
jgi:hypothetical protein